jgi:hypothetical protein
LTRPFAAMSPSTKMTLEVFQILLLNFSQILFNDRFRNRYICLPILTTFRLNDKRKWNNP